MKSGVPLRKNGPGTGKKSHLLPPPTSFGSPASPDSKSMVSSGPPPANKHMAEQEQTPRTMIRNAPPPVGKSGPDVAINLAGGSIEAKTPKTLIRDAPSGALVNEASWDPFKASMQHKPSKNDDAASLLRGFQSKGSGVSVKPRSPHNPSETVQSVPFQGSPPGGGGIAPPPIYSMPPVEPEASPGVLSSEGRRDTKPSQTQLVSGVPPKPKPKRGRRKQVAPSVLAIKAPRRVYESFLSCVNLLLSIAIFITSVGLAALVYQLYGQRFQWLVEMPSSYVKQAHSSLFDLLPLKLGL